MAGPPSRSSFPSVPGEPRVRRLGVGSSSGADRPLRAQVVVALVCAAMLIAVPLYLWRKPSTKTTAAAASASAAASLGSAAAAKPLAAAAPVLATPRLTLGAVQKVRCGASSSASPNEGSSCDSLPSFEAALKQAIISSEDCAPKAKLKGTINFVLTVDFARKKLHVFPGASGDFRGRQARRATTCVNSAVKVADWNVPHQFRFYALAILATYAGPAGSELPLPVPSAPAPVSAPALPNFE